MITRAKFVCYSIEDAGEGKRILLNAVTGGSAENDEFYDHTPGGGIRLEVVNEEAAKVFEQGKQYYVDFTPAE